MTIRWTPSAATSARRFMHDQAGMHAIVTAVTALAEEPLPVEGFQRGRYHRLRVGSYRILYVIDNDEITIERVDRVLDRWDHEPEFQRDAPVRDYLCPPRCRTGGARPGSTRSPRFPVRGPTDSLPRGRDAVDLRLVMP